MVPELPHGVVSSLKTILPVWNDELETDIERVVRHGKRSQERFSVEQRKNLRRVQKALEQLHDRLHRCDQRLIDFLGSNVFDQPHCFIPFDFQRYAQRIEGLSKGAKRSGPRGGHPGKKGRIRFLVNLAAVFDKHGVCLHWYDPQGRGIVKPRKGYFARVTRVLAPLADFTLPGGNKTGHGVTELLRTAIRRFGQEKCLRNKQRGQAPAGAPTVEHLLLDDFDELWAEEREAAGACDAAARQCDPGQAPLPKRAKSGRRTATKRHRAAPKRPKRKR